MANSLTYCALTHSPRPVHRAVASPVREKRMSERLQRGRIDAGLAQAEYLAKDVVENLLNENGVSINGYTGVLPGQLKKVPEDEPHLQEESFQQARKQIVCGCRYIMNQHGAEIEQVCMKVDVGDASLCSNVEEALSTIWVEPRNWGRLVSLFVAAYYLCKRIEEEEGKESPKIKSVIGWLGQFLKEEAVPWVVERGGFSGVLYGTNIKTVKQAAVDDCKSDYTKTSLFVTALGLGAAVVVGTIIGR